MSEPRPALFPARVTLPTGEIHDPARVATDTAGTTHAWVWDRTTNGPREVGSWPAVQLLRDDQGLTRRPTAFRTLDGTRIALTKGCGCGHPLKSWRPALVASGA